MSTTLPLFWNLSSAKKKERLDASVKLVSVLETLQAAHVPQAKQSSDEDDEEVEEDEDEDGEDEEKNEEDEMLNLLNAADVSYSIRRLIRGLASPRESSRLGFSVALTELLSRIDTVTTSQILTLILTSSKTSNSLSGKEERDLLFARLFGLTALIQSGLLTRQTPLPSSSSNTTSVSSLESFLSVISELIALGEKKSWLKESAWWSLGLAVENLQSCGDDVGWKEQAVEEVLRIIFGPGAGEEGKGSEKEKGVVWGPEKVALAIKVQRVWPEKDWRKLLGPTLKHGEVLHTGNMVALAKILKEADVEDDEDVPKVNARSWKPQVHYVWDILLDELLPAAPESKHAPKGSFQEFFRIVVDESLFAHSASVERKYWGFAIFQKALLRVKATDLPMLFTKNFMRTWINHLSHFDRYLHTFAKQIAGSMQTVVQKDPSIGLSFISQLTGVHGSAQFDKMTKTKTVESILTTMDTTGIKTYIEHLLSQVSEKAGSEQEDIQVVNSRRGWIIEQLAALVRNGAIPKTDEWLQIVLDWLVVQGMFIVKKKSEKSPILAIRSVLSPPLSEDLRTQCRARLLSCLAELTSQSNVVKKSSNDDDDKAQKMAGVASDGEFWVAKVLRTVEQLRKDVKHVEFIQELDESEQELTDKAGAVAEKLHKVTGEKHEAARGAELLLLSCLLQFYASNGDDSSKDLESLEACIDGAERLFPDESKKSKNSKRSKKASEAAADDEKPEEPEPIDVLVDTIIGFMEKATAYMRAVGNQSFSLLSGVVEGSTVDLILSQLERRSTAELLADDDDDEEMGADDEDDDEDDEGGDDDEEEDDGGEDEDEDESEADEPEDPELRRKITEVLRANGIEAATGDSDEESEEEEMDDDQMMAIDDQLAQIFKESRKGKSKDENAQREATHFKNRILDLLDIFIKRQPTSPHVLRLIIPLVDLVLGSGSDEQQLSDKTGGLLRSRVGKLKDVPTAVDVNEVTPILEELHTRARKVHSSDALAIISQCSLYVSKVLLHNQADDNVVQVYRQSLVDFMTRKASDLNARFFDDIIKRHPNVAWGFRDDLLDLTNKTVNTYRLCQAFALLNTLVNRMSSLEDHKAEFLPFMIKLSQRLQDVISTACRENTLTAPQLKDLLKLALLATRQTKRYTTTPEDLAKAWNMTSWNAVLTLLTTHDRFKTSAGLHSMCKQIVQLAQAQSGDTTSKKAKNTDSDKTKTAKRKAVEAEDESPVVNDKKAKRKKSKTT